jgi:hypothetical protein
MSVNNYYTVVKIDGTDVTGHIQAFQVNDSTETIVDTAKLILNTTILTTGLDLNPGSECTIQRGTNISNLIYIFRGYITAVAPQSTQVSIEMSNKLWILQQRQVTKSFDINIDAEGGNISEILYTLVTQYGGLNADNTTIVDSGTTYALTKFICRNDVVFERIMKLVDVLDWQFYYNPIDDKVYFEPLGYRTYDGVLTFTPTSSTIAPINMPELSQDFKNLYNRITVNGAKQLDTRTSNFTGDAITQNFTLPFTPLQTEITVAGVLKKRGTFGSSDAFDYYVDETLNKVSFAAAPAGGAAIVIKYSAMVPVPVVVDDPVSITSYCPVNGTTGAQTPFEKTFTYNDIINVDDAITRARKLLTYYATPLVGYNCDVLQSIPLFYPGYSVEVQDDLNNYTGTLVCKTIVRRYPEPYDSITLCDKRVFRDQQNTDIYTRIDLLEKESLRNTGVLVHIKQATRNYTWEKRSLKFSRRLVTGNQLIWDHITQGFWDTYKWASSSVTGVDVLTQVIPGGGTFKEYFYDTYYVDTTSTTTTIDTANLQAIL